MGAQKYSFGCKFSRNGRSAPNFVFWVKLFWQEHFWTGYNSEKGAIANCPHCLFPCRAITAPPIPCHDAIDWVLRCHASIPMCRTHGQTIENVTPPSISIGGGGTKTVNWFVAYCRHRKIMSLYTYSCMNLFIHVVQMPNDEMYILQLT